MEAGAVVKHEGKDNDLIERIVKEPMFGVTMEDMKKVLNPAHYVGRAPQQTEEYINNVVKPVLDANKEVLLDDAELNV
jgi:adenylosuccinate lyase